MARVRRLITIAALVAISLTVSISLFMLFGELNSAFFEQTSLRLGGPVAAFFVILYLLWYMYKSMHRYENPLEERLEPLVGSWKIESKSSESGRSATSTTRMFIEDGVLCLDGGTFFSTPASGAEGDAIGDWNVIMVISDGRRLKYFYTLTENPVNPVTWKGLVEVALQDDPGGPAFHGTWQVLGRNFHSGTIVMRKVVKARGND